MKKKIKFVQSIAGDKFSYRPGEEAMVEAHHADAWCASGIARPAEEDPADLRKQIAELQERLKKADPKGKEQ